MTFSGDLHGISLADVFQNVAGNRSSGWLEIAWQKRRCSVRFHEGAVAGFSFNPDERLVTPEFLAQRGYVQRQALVKLLHKHKRSKKTPAQLAVAGRLLEAQDAQDAVVTRVCEQIYELMTLREATFAFHEGEPPENLFDADQDPKAIRLEVGPLLLEGARRRDEYQRIARVLGADGGHVVLLEGWDQIELDARAADVAQYLDGRTDVRALMQKVAASRFDIQKSLSDLVEAGAARPATAGELDAFADEARENGATDEAIALLQQALAQERGNDDLRQKLVALLIELDRASDAVAELAKMAHQAARNNDTQTALELYARACEIDPGDVSIREQRVALLREAGDDRPYVEGLAELVAAYQKIGLADRAATALREAMAKRTLRTDTKLLGLLARVESSLGHRDEAARILRQLADGCIVNDEERGLALLHAALEHTPDDDVLAARIRDLESGRAQRSRARRRRLVVSAVSLTVATALGMAGFAEFRATRRMIDAFDQSLSLLRGGDAVEAIAELDGVARGFFWSPTSHRAHALLDRVADLQLAAVETRLRDGDYGAAREVLASLAAHVDRADVRTTCETLLKRVDAEQRAGEILARADRDGDPAPQELDELRALTQGCYLDFHLARLPRIANAPAKRAVLQALLAIDSARTVPTVARMFLTETDREALDTMRELFESSKRFRGTPAASEWLRLRPLLAEKALADETRGQARYLLEVLF